MNPPKPVPRDNKTLAIAGIRRAAHYSGATEEQTNRVLNQLGLTNEKEQNHVTPANH